MLKLGDTYQEELSFKQSDVEKFAEISGDCNPLHLDKEFAKTTPFGRPIVHGFLSGAVFSKVFGTTFPGEGTIYMYQEMKFTGPVFVDTPYVAKFVITEVDTTKHRASIKCTLETMDGKVCIDGLAKLKNDREFI